MTNTHILNPFVFAVGTALLAHERSKVGGALRAA